MLAGMDEQIQLARARQSDVDDLVFDEARRLRATSSLAVETTAVPAARVNGDNAARHADARVAFGLTARDGRVVVTVYDDASEIRAADRARAMKRGRPHRLRTGSERLWHRARAGHRRRSGPRAQRIGRDQRITIGRCACRGDTARARSRSARSGCCQVTGGTLTDMTTNYVHRVVVLCACTPVVIALGACAGSTEPRATSPSTAGPATGECIMQITESGQQTGKCLPVAPSTARVDLAVPAFSRPTDFTNRLHPSTTVTQAIYGGQVDKKPFRTEVKLLPETTPVTWKGTTVDTVTVQYLAYSDGRITETAIDKFAQADDGSVWTSARTCPTTRTARSPTTMGHGWPAARPRPP